MERRMTPELPTNSELSSPANLQSQQLAIFDLDYTLTKRGTWGHFIWDWVKFRPHIWLPLLLSAGWMQIQYKRGLRPRADVKISMMRWAMKGASKETVLRKGRKFAAKTVPHGLREGGIKAVKDHKAKGDILIMISAAVDVVAHPIADLLGFDHVLATEMAFDSEGILKLGFNTPNCYGPEKVSRLNALITDFPELQPYAAQITVYSDSYSDLSMFNRANISVAIHPDKRLSRHAAENNWHIFKW